MPSTYSPLLRLELVGAGEQSGLWGDTTNKNMGALLDQAIAGVAVIPLTGGTGVYEVQALDGTSDEARCAVLQFTGAPSGAKDIQIPSTEKLYVVRNDSTQIITVKTAAQVANPVLGGVPLLPSEATLVFCNGAAAVKGIQAEGVGVLGVAGGGTGRDNFATAGFLKTPGGQGGFGSVANISLDSADTSGTLPATKGGTGITSAGTAGNGLISTGAGWQSAATVNSIVGGTGITVTGSAGSFTISTSGGGSGVTTFNGRAGAVSPQSNDYSSFYATTSAPTFTSYITTPRVYYGNSPGSMSVYDNGGEMQFVVGGLNSAKVTSAGIGCGGLAALSNIESTGGYITSRAGGFSRLGDNSVFMFNAACNHYNNGSQFGWTWNAVTIAALTNAGAMFNLTGTYGTISDARIKENIVPARNYLDSLCQLDVVNYNLIDNPQKMLGFVAQQVETVMPGLVETSVNEDYGIEDFKSIKTSVMLPMLVQAIQELKAGLDAANAEIAALKAK